MSINKDRKCYTDKPDITEGILRELIETSKKYESLDKLIGDMTDFANELTAKRAHELQDYAQLHGHDLSFTDVVVHIFANDPYYRELRDD